MVYAPSITKITYCVVYRVSCFHELEHHMYVFRRVYVRILLVVKNMVMNILLKIKNVFLNPFLFK